MDNKQAPELRKQNAFVPKKADYTTVLCFVKRNRIEYTPKDMHAIGKKLVEIYRQLNLGKDPMTIQQVEGRSVIVVNVYPYEFSKHIHRVVNEYFKQKA